MTKIWRKLGLVLIVTLAFAACERLQPVYNVDQDSIPANVQQKLSASQIGKIIATAAIENGWQVRETKPGLLHCTTAWQQHSAAVDIAYSKVSYSIQLDSSQNLMQSGDMIHRNYNHRVQKLQAAIDKKLSLDSYN